MIRASALPNHTTHFISEDELVSTLNSAGVLLRSDGAWGTASCGSYGSITNVASSVSCKRCWKTKAFKDGGDGS